ncbi:ROK family protein [Paenibacillus woosongensis]|uniref:ROK family protein n=1 Tax=Paenibacillus woosongensis TaxID=307580 RepID=A0AA95IAX5_9BACL|nr:ROK family protein [Paenibacillus woosongensis]WHX51322.1 ROK family protein [Paenibacillus woosongensis]
MRILAADIGGTNTKLCICDEQGKLEQFQEYATESRQGGPHVMSRLMDKLAEYDNFDAIAISTAGQVDSEAGFIVYANENIPDYTGMRIKNMLEERFHKPVKVENDVNAAALGEAFFGAARHLSDFLCLTYGTGIGGAIVIDRRVYKGAKGVAAEFGHIVTHAGANSRNVAQPLFYEKYASTTALVQMAGKVDPDCTNGRILFEKIKQGNSRLEQVMHAWVDEVAYGLASIIHIFNPSAVIVGGGVMEQDELVRLVEARTKATVMESYRDVKILKASLGNKAGVLGAASLFFR